MANGAEFDYQRVADPPKTYRVKPEMLTMLKLASEKDIQKMVYDFEAGGKECKKAVERVQVNEMRYRCSQDLITHFQRGNKP